MLLPNLEHRLLHLVSSFNLRPTLDRAIEIGELLLEAKLLVPHGQWMPWLHRIGLHQRTAHDYMAVARHKDQNQRPAAKLGVKGFLHAIRKARRAAKQAEYDEQRQRLRQLAGKLPDNIHLHNRDCRQHRWTQYDAIACDPPWQDTEAYAWLAEFGQQHLQEGGLLLAQCGKSNLPEVISILGSKLRYVWTLAICYVGRHCTLATGIFQSGWLPLLLFAKGKPRVENTAGDCWLQDRQEKTHHVWEQPVAPWKNWLMKLLLPQSSVADPFAGSATIGVACLQLGHSYEGTEIDPKSYRVARGRLVQAAKQES